VDNTKGTCFIDSLTVAINNLIAGTSVSGSTDPRVQLAVLLVAKKRALAMLKAHLQRYLQDHTSTYTTDMSKPDGDYKNIYSAWKVLLNDIDTKITNLEQNALCVPIVKGIKCGNSVATLDSIGSNTISSYYSSSVAQPGMA
jgi:hypothetical protein